MRTTYIAIAKPKWVQTELRKQWFKRCAFNSSRILMLALSEMEELQTCKLHEGRAIKNFFCVRTITTQQEIKNNPLMFPLRHLIPLMYLDFDV